MTSTSKRETSYLSGEDSEDVKFKPFFRDAIAIVEEGYLVQWAGINPETGEPWKPSWVAKRDCRPELVARWTADSVGRSDTAAPSRPAALKRSSSPTIKGEHEDIGVSSEKRQRRDSIISHDVPGTSGVRRVHGLPPKPPPQMFIPKTKQSANKHMTKPAVAPYPDSTSWSPEFTAASNVVRKPYELNAEWLLDPIISTKNGMLVVIQNSFGNSEDTGWFGGQYEGEKGVVLSVFVTGNTSFTSTARVRILDPINPSTPIFTIPVKYLWPVEPDEAGQNALLLDGDARGEVVKIREEDLTGWFVSIGHSQHFVTAADTLVRVLEVDIDGNTLGR